MPSVWFIVPAHQRVALTRACLKQLRRTCDTLQAHGIAASAVVIADDENLDAAHELGFWGYERPNNFLGQKLNDGYEVASREGVEYVIPCGSDDWVHPDFVLQAPLDPAAIRCARKMAMVSEDGRRFMRLTVSYEGGAGMRITPMRLLAPYDYRPVEEDRSRAVDTATLRRLKRANGFGIPLEYLDAHDFQIVDFKSSGANLNTWDMCRVYGGSDETDPWQHLAQHYPAEALEDMRAVYAA